MPALDPLSPPVVYALRNTNIKYPGTQAQATADETNATNRLNDAFNPSGVTVTVPAGTIKVAT